MSSSGETAHADLSGETPDLSVATLAALVDLSEAVEAGALEGAEHMTEGRPWGGFWGELSCGLLSSLLDPLWLAGP